MRFTISAYFRSPSGEKSSLRICCCFSSSGSVSWSESLAKVAGCDFGPPPFPDGGPPFPEACGGDEVDGGALFPDGGGAEGEVEADGVSGDEVDGGVEADGTSPSGILAFIMLMAAFEARRILAPRGSILSGVPNHSCRGH